MIQMRIKDQVPTVFEMNKKETKGKNKIKKNVIKKNLVNFFLHQKKKKKYQKTYRM